MGLKITIERSWASLVAQMVKYLPAMWETWVSSLDWEDSLEDSMDDLTPYFHFCLSSQWSILKSATKDSQFSSVAHSCLTLCDPMDYSTPGFPVHHQLPEFAQTHVHWIGDAIQPSHPLSSPSPPAFNPSQHQGLFQWVISLHKVTKGLEFQLQHQIFQWTVRTDFL